MPRRIDISGKRFRKLVVVRLSDKKRSGRRVWECLCDCGNTTYVDYGSLATGNTGSCGCSITDHQAETRVARVDAVRGLDLSGARFGSWVVVRRTDERSDNRVVWECICDCGVVALRNASSIVSARSMECRHKKKSKFDHVADKAYWAYKRGAKTRGLVFDIGIDFFAKMSSLPCSYCGRSGVNRMNVRRASLGDIEPVSYNGIDRVDSSIGYVESNCVPCCGECNRAKSDMSAEHFVDLCRMVAKHRSTVVDTAA